jgi:hypothetical protein
MYVFDLQQKKQSIRISTLPFCVRKSQIFSKSLKTVTINSTPGSRSQEQVLHNRPFSVIKSQKYTPSLASPFKQSLWYHWSAKGLRQLNAIDLVLYPCKIEDAQYIQ